MTEAMLHSHYPLQAMLYSVVLHRYLRWRQPGYDPERHLGGVLYLYVRGMCGPETPLVDGNPVRRLLLAPARRDGRRAVRPARRSVPDQADAGSGVVTETLLDATGATGGSPCGATGLLRTFNEADVLARRRRPRRRAARRDPRRDPRAVLLAAALAVRAVRHGSICVDLDTIAELAVETRCRGRE